jgi:hypothetical protein
MHHVESDGDVRLRSSARASLARLETEVDPHAAWLEFRDRLDGDPYIRTTDVGPRRLARQFVGLAILLLLIAAAGTALVRHEGEPRTATVVPQPTDTAIDDTSPENSTDAVAPLTTDELSLAPAELVALLGRTWVITRMDGQPRAFAAYFEMESGKATGHDGCNFYDSTIQLQGIADGAVTMLVTSGGSTDAPCAPPYEAGWPAPSGRYRVDGDSLTITADDGTTFDAVDLDSLPIVATVDGIASHWSVPDGTGVEFAGDGTIRLPCATIGTWAFTDELHTTIDQTAAATGCSAGELRSLGWTYDALLSGSPTTRRLGDGSLLFGSAVFGSSQLGHIVPPIAAPVDPPVSVGVLLRPFVDPGVCAPLAVTGDGDAIGSTSDLHLFARPTIASSFPIQIIGDPNGGPAAPFALVQRYPDQLDLGQGETIRINDWDVVLGVFANGNGDARWALPDGGQGYLRSRGLDRDGLIAIVSSLTARDSNAAIPGFDYTPGPTVPPTLQLLVEHLNTSVYGRGAALQCQVVSTNFIYRISTLDGDPVFQYAGVIDRPVPLEVGYKLGTLVVIEGIDDPTAPAVNDVVNTDVATWDNLRTNPPS